MVKAMREVIWRWKGATYLEKTRKRRQRRDELGLEDLFGRLGGRSTPGNDWKRARRRY
jgi:hypothetical protein